MSLNFDCFKKQRDESFSPNKNVLVAKIDLHKMK